MIEVGPLLDLRIVIVFTVPVGNIAGGGESNLFVFLGVAVELAQQQRVKRPAADTNRDRLLTDGVTQKAPINQVFDSE